MQDFTVIVLEGAYGSSVAMTLDLLGAAAELAPGRRAPAPRWQLCSMGGGAIRLQSGLRVETLRLEARSRPDDCWVVPGLALDTEGAVIEGLSRPDCRQLAAAISRHVEGGGRVAACCSAVFVLHLAGVLDGRQATTAWWLAPLLQRLAPACRVSAKRMVCVDEPIVTGGAAFAQTDLMLHLLRRQCGARVADSLSRYLLVDARESQVRPPVPRAMASGDTLVSRIVERIEASLPNAPSVSMLAKELCVSERTLARHVYRITGTTPMALLQGVKLRRARSLIEQSRLSIEQIAAAVGYSDPTALRRLMRKATGSNPSQFRCSVADA